MEILLWLVPPVVVSLVAMAWVGWLGREGRGEIDREEAARRIGRVLERGSQVPGPPATEGREGSSGVAVRRPRPPVGPIVTPPVAPAVAPPVPTPAQPLVEPLAAPAPKPRRLAS